MPMTTELLQILANFVNRPLQELNYDALCFLYDQLVNYQFENEDSLDEEESFIINQTLDIIQSALDSQTLGAQTLTSLLIENPVQVEYVLSTLSLYELLNAEKRCKEIESPLLRKQYENMVTRCLRDLVCNSPLTS